jgi:hypothetical protein
MLNGTVAGNGLVYGEGSRVSPLGPVAVNGTLELSGLLLVFGSLEGYGGTFSGAASLNGTGTVVGNATDEEPEEPEFEFNGGMAYLTTGLIAFFAMLLAAIVCSDIISEDLADSSFVLYFSRPVRTFDYLAGKLAGLASVMGLFALIPPIAFVLVMIGTQTGSDYSSGLRILGLTVIAGLFTSVFFLPYGLMISSFTKRKAYAGIGIFMSFFVLTLIAGLFGEFSDKWMLIDPFQLLHAFYIFLFGGDIGADISGPEVAAAILAMTVIPMVIVYILIERKGAGK